MSSTIHAHPTPWKLVILICGKCSRKLDGGYGPKGKTTLRSSLKEALKDQGYRREVRVVETRCFGICPKNAIVALNGTIPDRLLTIPHGMTAKDTLKELLNKTDGRH